ncbi:NAD-dependent epimerase/dehydratase family protein [Haladaptatus sp. T7]|uniref:NAD-dependent epimerase/dehydratase family protein n=1 Tax=Haladaptatus sp. T7 TaxID=2029368 RepID=UPI0021A25524|nr:NAD-dependent epimerase/dehydratase family protein [Haladaptatus sp. T7]GKZ12517.1 NDP-sugar dehydratase or epimerase [Haladaptatus sp. T7]
MTEGSASTPRTAPRDRTILITGGAGFVGSHLAESFARDNDVRILDDFSTGKRGNVPADATLIEGDVRDPEAVAEAMADVDIVFHEAAMVSVSRSVEHPLRSHAVTGNGSLVVLDRARREDARVVLASSAAVYGHPDAVPVVESEHKRPTSPYGIDKLTADQYARRFSDLYGIETVTLRYFNVYGPRQNPEYSAVVRTFLDQARRGEDITIQGDGTQTRDFVHVDDVVQANCRAATTDRTGEAFNVGTGESVTIRELAETIRSVTDSSSDIVHTDPRPGDIDHSRADITKARTALGYEPTVSLSDGLAELVEEPTV